MYVCVEGGSRRRVGRGARQLAPHLAAPHTTPPPANTQTRAYLFHVTLWARLARRWRGAWRRGPNQGFNQYTSLVKDRPDHRCLRCQPLPPPHPPSARQQAPRPPRAALISGLTGLVPPLPEPQSSFALFLNQILSVLGPERALH